MRLAFSLQSGPIAPIRAFSSDIGVTNLSRPDKATLRKTVLASRDAKDEASRVEAALAVADHASDVPAFDGDVLAGSWVSSFLPIRSEIDARPLMAVLADRGARLCLPVVQDRTTIVFRELVRGGELVDTGFGTLGPPPEAEVVDPAVMIVPLAAFDSRGGRIGYGAGHYDRAIARLMEDGKPPRLVGLAFALQQVGHVPVEAHDQPLEGVLTENGYIACAGAET